MKILLIFVIAVSFCMISCNEKRGKTLVTDKDSITSEKSKALYGEKSVFWEVKSENTTAFILGSIHLSTEYIHPLPKKFIKAFDMSKYLVMECDLRDVDPTEVYYMTQYKDGSLLKDHISKEAYDSIRAYFNRFGLKELYFGKIKPGWAVMQLLTFELEKQGNDSKYGIDKYFMDLAVKKNKPILEMESLEFQFEKIEEMFSIHTDDYILYSLDRMKNAGEDKKKSEEAWIKGDLDKILELAHYEKNDDPRFEPITKIALDDRNIGMVEKIEGYLKSGDGPYFIVAGSSHMVGEMGIINLLKETGKYKITRL